MRIRRNPRRRPSHPGAMLWDLVPVGCSKARLARALGLSRYQLSEILAEKRPVTKATALKLATVFGGSAQSWTDMQAAYVSGLPSSARGTHKIASLTPLIGVTLTTAELVEGTHDGHFHHRLVVAAHRWRRFVGECADLTAARIGLDIVCGRVTVSP